MSQPPLDFRNVNSLWSSVIVETLVQCGLRQAVISPGSRSTPLVFALVAHPDIEAIPLLDERSAAFFALGLARQRLRPVLLVCTSGTAGANYYPAVIEARESGVPLLIMTADRPPEMRACASGQTIDQQKLYGDRVNFHHELAVPEASLGALRYLRQTVAHACGRCSQPALGPVHLNVPFRDPLAPVIDNLAEGLSAAADWEHFFSHLGLPAAIEAVARAPQLGAELHGVIVAGPAQPRDPNSYIAAVAEIAGKLGWPVLADALSPVRNHAGRVPNLVSTYDAVLREPGAAERLRPEVVLCIGGWPTSKVLRTWLEAGAMPIWLITGRPDNRDPLHGRTRQLAISLRTLAGSLPQASGVNGYAEMWMRYETRARMLLDTRLQDEAGLFEPKAVWLLAQHLPVDTPVFLANSMPVRDAEYVWPPGDRNLRPFFNRGANGIDGTLSSALGMAHGNRPGVLLTGDLALLHDTNGFLARPKFVGSLTVVLINNRGGGIFGHLPVAAFDPPFEEFFATPQEADFAQLCAAYGVDHVRVEDWPQFITLISTLPETGIRVLELATDRKGDVDARKKLFADVVEI